uniref:WD_REPEATS_REGION domain-containing protein n=1 Tax=Onchocerca volvulus TaxID=6282 RepID=A0A8R1XWP4_ONCVO
MYELRQEILMSTGSVSHSPNNLSVFLNETKGLTLACVIHENQVATLSWDQGLNSFTCDNLPIKANDSDASIIVLQAKYCMPVCRTFPLLVVTTSKGVMVYDVKTCKLLAWNEMNDTSEPTIREQMYRFTRGITCVENLIVVGSHSGELLVFRCTGENSIIFKGSVQEHDFTIVDIATCRFDDLTCSCDVSGHIAVWYKNFKSARKKFSTGHEINCINVLRKQVIIGTFTGQLLFYSTLNGQLMAEVNAHIRQINAIAVAPESAYIISVSDDTMIRLWKLHVCKPEAYRVEWQHNKRVENMPLVGVQFTNDRGSGFVVAAYDYSKLLYYQITKLPAGQMEQ